MARVADFKWRRPLGQRGPAVEVNAGHAPHASLARVRAAGVPSRAVVVSHSLLQSAAMHRSARAVRAWGSVGACTGWAASASAARLGHAPRSPSPVSESNHADLVM